MTLIEVPAPVKYKQVIKNGNEVTSVESAVTLGDFIEGVMAQYPPAGQGYLNGQLTREILRAAQALNGKAELVLGDAQYKFLLAALDNPAMGINPDLNWRCLEFYEAIRKGKPTEITPTPRL